MKIEKIIIYGFGQHVNKTINFTKSSSIIYGLNEAGKTTIQQFILQILFGFPQKNSTYAKYDPKTSDVFGGQIELVDEQYGRCTIERVRKEKAIGDVTVYFANGTIGNEQDLAKILRDYDRISFEAVFSFSMLQLQSFEKMTEDELSRTLLASGTTGVDALLLVEKQMDKEMGDIFKKTGRNPQLNQQLRTLRDMSRELQETQQQISKFEPMRLEVIEVENALAKNFLEHEKLEEQSRSLQMIAQYFPLFEESEQLKQKLEKIKVTRFPTDGIRRIEVLQDKLRTVITKERAVLEQIKEKKQLIATTSPTDDVLLIEEQLAFEHEWHEWHAKRAYTIAEQAKLEEQLLHLKQRLGMTNQFYAEIDDADVSIQKEEEMVQILREIDEIQRDEHILEVQFKQVEQRLVEQQVKRNKRHVEDDKHVQDWPTQRKELMNGRAMIHVYNQQLTFRLLPIVLLLMAICLVAYGVIKGGLILISIGILLGIFGFYSWKYMKRIQVEKDRIERNNEQYASNEEQMEQLYERYLVNEQEQTYREQVIHKLNAEQQEIQEKLSIVLQLNYEKNMQLEQFMQQYGFEGMLSSSIVPQLFQMMREVQDCKRKMKQLIQEQFECEQKINMRILELEKVVSVNDQAAIYPTLRKAYAHAVEITEQVKQAHRQLQEQQEELRVCELEKGQLEQSIQELLLEAEVESVATFYEAAKRNEEQQRDRAKLETITKQFPYGLDMLLFQQYDQITIQEEVKECTATLDRLHTYQVELIEKKAKLQSRMQHLLEDETYYEKRQQFEMKKAEVQQLVKQWAGYKAVSEAIAQTMKVLKEEQLPAVLKIAEQYFITLTNGRYDALQLSTEGYFIAIGKEGIRFQMYELSQATKEQAYISLRFALASSLKKKAPLPIILDDPFVHFDERRLSSMMNVIQKLSDHQFIYFTCHKKMQHVWRDAEVINVSSRDEMKEFDE